MVIGGGISEWHMGDWEIGYRGWRMENGKMAG